MKQKDAIRIKKERVRRFEQLITRPKIGGVYKLHDQKVVVLGASSSRIVVAEKYADRIGIVSYGTMWFCGRCWPCEEQLPLRWALRFKQINLAYNSAMWGFVEDVLNVIYFNKF